MPRKPEPRIPQPRQDGPGRSRARCERPPNGVPTGGQEYRHPAGDLPRLRSRPRDAVGQAGTGCARYPHVVRRSARRVRPESEGHRARSRGDPAGRTRIAGLQCSDVLHESRQHLPAADDHFARWRACPRVALRDDRRGREVRITFYPAAVDLCHEEFEQVGDAIPFEAEKPRTRLRRDARRISGICGWEALGEKRAAMAVAAAVATPSRDLWGSARGEVGRGHAAVGCSRRAIPGRHGSPGGPPGTTSDDSR